MAELLEGCFAPEEWELEEMDREALLEQLAAVRQGLTRLDETEPEDMESEDYQLWGDRHEELEDLEDAILDRLDMLEGRP